MAFSTAVREPFRLSWRILLRGLAWLGTLLLLAALGLIVYAARQQYQANEELMLEDPVIANYNALENAIYYTVDRLGYSPADKDELLAQGVLGLPKKKLWLNQDLVNPYTDGPVRFVEPGQPFADGDCIYFPAMYFSTSGNVEQPPLQRDFYLLVFGPQRATNHPQDLSVDFNLDGRKDEFCFMGGNGFSYSCKMGPGNSAEVESLHEVLIRLGLEQYWIGEPEQAD
ncbi:hypothetical protein IT575_05980 [bacterium]|nr:hypothetical protein [bacterium]